MKFTTAIQALSGQTAAYQESVGTSFDSCKSGTVLEVPEQLEGVVTTGTATTEVTTLWKTERESLLNSVMDSENNAS